MGYFNNMFHYSTINFGVPHFKKMFHYSTTIDGNLHLLEARSFSHQQASASFEPGLGSPATIRSGGIPNLGNMRDPGN